jgi:hypothetical protein
LAIHKAKRPVIVNGIPRLAEREDLANRTFTISLPPMTGDRLTEPELLQRWQGARPRILAGLLDGVCRALRNVDGVTLPEEPRIVGALKWAVAAEPNFGFDDGEVFTACQDSARETTQASVFCGRAGLDHDLQLPMPGTLALCRKRRKRLEGLFTVTTRSLNRVQSLRSMRPGKSPTAMLGEAECASGKPGERR